MKYVLAIDPGAQTGVALFHGTTLLACDCLQPWEVGDLVKRWAMDKEIHFQVVCEFPRYYRDGGEKNVDAILKLAYHAGLAVGGTGRIGAELITPRDWKGTIKKEIMTARIINGLSEGERALVEKLRLPPTKAHNVIDAIGLGKWFIRQRGTK